MIVRTWLQFEISFKNVHTRCILSMEYIKCYYKHTISRYNEVTPQITKIQQFCKQVFIVKNIKPSYVHISQ